MIYYYHYFQLKQQRNKTYVIDRLVIPANTV